MSGLTRDTHICIDINVDGIMNEIRRSQARAIFNRRYEKHSNLVMFIILILVAVI